MSADKGYIELLLSDEDRNKLLNVFPPRYERVIANNLTYKFGVSSTESMPESNTISIVGLADDDRGIQCLIAEVDGTRYRSDRSTYHVAWSLDSNRKVSDANKLAQNWPDDYDNDTQVELTEKININCSPVFILLY